MSKKGGGGDFTNRAARRFRKPDKVDHLPQGEIFSILQEDIGTILEQVTQYRTNHGKFPQYIQFAFANLSTPLWFHLYVKDHVKVTKKGKLKSDLSEDELESLRYIIADIYKKSATNQYPQQMQEFGDRNRLLGKTFARLCPDKIKIAKKLKLRKGKTRELAIQVYGRPVQNIRFVCKLFDSAVGISDKKKMKILKKLYGKKRFIQAVGAAMTISKNDSDCVEMIFNYFKKLKSKKRAPIIMAFAEAYKENKSRNNLRMSEEKFYKKNKKFFKELIEIDIGFKKAFRDLKPDSDKPEKKDKKGKKDKNSDPWMSKKSASDIKPYNKNN